MSVGMAMIERWLGDYSTGWDLRLSTDVPTHSVATAA